MEKHEDSDREQQRTQKLARKMANKILGGRDHVTLNPRFYGIGGYRVNTDFYDLTQTQLEAAGVTTEIRTDTIPSGSDADDLIRHTLHVTSRQSPQQQ